MRLNTFFAIFVVATFFISSCGYTLQDGYKLPDDIKTISVMVFKNSSSQTGAEIIFTNALIEELMGSTTVKVINHEQITNTINSINADAVIQGTIISISFDALARTSYDLVYKRGINAVINLEMKSKKGDVLFAVKDLTDRESYTVYRENFMDQALIDSALKKVAKRIAKRVVSQMGDSF
ncbi:MAG: hypothetical protein HQK64_12920 [Desulfamplus sp.]|nr:hypothetical protein [Desulfamplus sp.]